ncbi:unnamed protein product [Polarella glacialis]|uniref:Alcohol dehydrogenase-like N-terminal domain-containing protein n=1 Tax=Polarella glacialis TaxID=89957 RepID=A0A813IR75_POLGL|nr:unnamed protein product [Polarella glacialis]
MAIIVSGTGTLMLEALDESYKLTQVEIGRPAPGPNDVAIDINYCGMCHSDLHTINGDWGAGKYPIAPGHEAAGVVREVGAEAAAAGFKVGDSVAVGCMAGAEAAAARSALQAWSSTALRCARPTLTCSQQDATTTIALAPTRTTISSSSSGTYSASAGNKRAFHLKQACHRRVRSLS